MTPARGGGRRVWVLVALTGALAACGTTSLSAATVAKGAEDALEKKVGTRPDITCPKDLDATVGATTRCTLTVGKDPAKYGVTVVVTSVKDGNATFDVRVDRTPQG
ncbi:MAG: DUF4333 domain-containing protein [Blastococcus sp.]